MLDFGYGLERNYRIEDRRANDFMVPDPLQSTSSRFATSPTLDPLVYHVPAQIDPHSHLNRNPSERYGSRSVTNARLRSLGERTPDGEYLVKRIERKSMQ